MVLAHAGDWVADILFAGPVLALIVGLVIVKLRERRAARQEGLDPPADGPPDARARDAKGGTADPDEQERS